MPAVVPGGAVVPALVWEPVGSRRLARLQLVQSGFPRCLLLLDGQRGGGLVLVLRHVAVDWDARDLEGRGVAVGVGEHFKKLLATQ